MKESDIDNDGINSDEYNSQENTNLLNLINHDLKEDESDDDSDEVIFENKNIHLNLDEDKGVDSSREEKKESNAIDENNILKKERIPDIVNEDGNESSSGKLTDISDHVNSSDENNILQKANTIDSREIVSEDSLSDNITDVSENDDNDDSIEHGRATVISNIPNINVVRNTDTSDDSSTSNNSKKKFREKRKKSSEELSKIKSRLEEESKNCEILRSRLRDETDAKERLENSLSELQKKYECQSKDEEELRHQLHKKDELNSILERKELKLIQELVEVKSKLSENLDNQRKLTYNPSLPHELQTLNEKLQTERDELQSQLHDGKKSLAHKNTHIQLLDQEMLKEKLSQYEDEEVVQQLQVVASEALPDTNQLQDKIKTMVEQVIDDSHKKLQIRDLEEEVVELKQQLDENKDKYNANISEALSTLKQVQDAYGEMRDVVLEGYKEEVASLNDRVRIAEEKNNEDIITGLRQELLDARLQQERSKQGYKDEMEIQQKKFDECESKIKELLNEIEKLKLDLETKVEHNKTSQDSLQKTQSVADERKHEIEELNRKLNSMNSLRESIVEKDGLISELKTQLVKEAQILTKEHAEKETLQMEVELMESVKRQNQRLEEEIEEMNHKVKLRGTKIKFLKKHIKELEEQKQKAETLMLVIPEMQKKIDELTEEKEKLKQDIIDKEKEEEETKRKIEEEKREEEERVQKEKENWEKRILGIGKCLEFHEEEKDEIDTNRMFNRPNSAPLIKPRPPTAKRHTSKNHSKSSLYRAPTLNPAFLHSYPEGRKATQKMKQHQEKIILSTQSRDNLFRSVTKPMSYSNASFKHISEGKYFPRISPRSKDNTLAPRVLVWGNGDGPGGNKMVAVGDLVLTNLHSECSTHGHCSKQQPGIVKFIGFVDGNDDNVYIGLRLEEEVGYTDGMIQGKRYFRSEPEKGAFVHLDDIVEVLQTQTKHVPTLTM